MKNQSGLTLIELIVSISIAAVLVCIALPFAQSFYKRNQLELVAADISHAVLQARNLALIHHTPVTLSALKGNNWPQGMQMYHSKNPENILHLWQWSQQDLQLSWKGFQSDTQLLFSPELRHMACNGRFILRNALFKKEIIINRLCRVRSNQAILKASG